MKFLSRTLNPNTMTWAYSDGSGGIYTEEDRQEVFDACARRVPGGGNGIFVLAKLDELRKKRV